MAKKFMNLLAATGRHRRRGDALCPRGSQARKGRRGDVDGSGKNYSLKHALAYETTMDEEERIVVVLSGQAISSEKLKEARAEEKDGHDASF